MLVEGFECADESARVLQHDSHSIVEVLNHFVVLADGLEERWMSLQRVFKICLHGGSENNISFLIVYNAALTKLRKTSKNRSNQ